MKNVVFCKRHLLFCLEMQCASSPNTDKSKHRTWTRAEKWIQSIIMFTWYKSGDCTAENNTNNMLKLTDLVKNYVGFLKSFKLLLKAQTMDKWESAWSALYNTWLVLLIVVLPARTSVQVDLLWCQASSSRSRYTAPRNQNKQNEVLENYRMITWNQPPIKYPNIKWGHI